MPGMSSKGERSGGWLHGFQPIQTLGGRMWPIQKENALSAPQGWRTADLSPTWRDAVLYQEYQSKELDLSEHECSALKGRDRADDHRQ